MAEEVNDPRIIVRDADRIVLKIARADQPRSTMIMTVVASAAIALALGGLWWFFRPLVSPWAATVLWLILTLAAVLFSAREGTLVALRSENKLMVEWRNRLTRSKQRTLDVSLSDLTGYDVRPFVDLDGNVVPSQLYELRLIVNGTVPVWYTSSRDAAAAVGEALLSMRARITA